eukprot:184142-Prymnesium_polylepis.1
MARVRDARTTRAGCVCVNGLRGRGTRTRLCVTRLTWSSAPCRGRGTALPRRAAWGTGVGR